MSIKLSQGCTWEAQVMTQMMLLSCLATSCVRPTFDVCTIINIVNNYYLQCPFFVFFTFFLCRAFDLANHFCEWMIDYTVAEPVYFSVALDKWPSKEQQVC